jgi:hypothetical protein
MKTFLILTIVQTISLFSYGFILPLDLILQKNVSANGNQVISVEQDVFFKDGAQELAIHESWLIEGDKNLKMTATGLGELKDSLKIVALYNGKNRTIVVGKNRQTEVVGPDFFEKYLSIRSVDSYKTYLTELHITPSVRLSRASGAIAFAIGEPSTPNALKPQFWIQQDNFHLNKIRLPSAAEVAFDDYLTIGTQLNYPKTKRLNWAGKSVLIKVKSVNDKAKVPASTFYAQNLDTPSELLISNKNTMGLMIEEFYKRFR